MFENVCVGDDTKGIRMRLLTMRASNIFLFKKVASTHLAFYTHKNHIGITSLRRIMIGGFL